MSFVPHYKHQTSISHRNRNAQPKDLFYVWSSIAHRVISSSIFGPRKFTFNFQIGYSMTISSYYNMIAAATCNTKNTNSILNTVHSPLIEIQNLSQRNLSSELEPWYWTKQRTFVHNKSTTTPKLRKKSFARKLFSMTLNNWLNIRKYKYSN